MGVIMFYYSDKELSEMVSEWSKSIDVSYWWYRDVVLQAQERGLVKVIAHTEDKPFWWRSFAESIEILDKAKDIMTKNAHRGQ
jgi:hypothetical protein